MRINPQIVKYGCDTLLRYIRSNLSLPFFLNKGSYPDQIRIYPTFRCNLRCKQCGQFKPQYDSKEMPAWQWITMLKKLRRWLGTYHLVILGGEPFIREDILDIIEFAHSQGICTRVVTNATLINEDIARKIINSRLDFISISLDGRAESHDFLRGKNTYEKVLKAIDLLKSHIKVTITTTIMSTNIQDLVDIILFCKKNNLGIVFNGLSVADETKYLWPANKEKLTEVFRTIVRLKRGNRVIRDPLSYITYLSEYYTKRSISSRKCTAYKKGFKVMPNGDVRICTDDYPIIGNILDDEPEHVWSSKNSIMIRNEIKSYSKQCAFLRCYYPETFKETIQKAIQYLISN